MLTICPVCGEEFNACRSQKYCSPECRQKAKELRKKTKTKICIGCGIQFIPTGQNQKYHSIQCRKKSTYKENYVNIVLKYHDKNKFGGNREKAMERDGYKCVQCGGTKQLGVHHKDRTGQTDHPNHDINNLETLCNKCHSQEHGKDKSGDRTAYWTTCQHCGKPLKTTPYRVSIGAGTYCSAKCRDAANVKLESEKQDGLTHSLTKPNWYVVTCSNPDCGIEFEVPPYRIKRSLERHGEIILYHCRSCRTAVENHKRAGTYKIQNKENFGKGKRGPNKKYKTLNIDSLPDAFI